MTTRAESSLRRRAAVMRATADLIDEIGIEALTLRDVADRADVAPGTIFLYVDSKSELITQVLVDRFGSRWLALLDDLADLDPVDRVEQFYLGCVDIFYEDFEQGTELYRSLWARPTTGYAPIVDLFSRTTKLLLQAQESGAIRPDLDPGQLSILYSTTYNVAINAANLGANHQEARSTLGAALGVIRRGIAR